MDRQTQLLNKNILKDLYIECITFNWSNMQDLACNIDTSLKNIFSWFDNNRLLINNEKSLAIGFHHKKNKNIIFQDIIIKDRQITYVYAMYVYL
jgi:hypothetical protein